MQRTVTRLAWTAKRTLIITGAAGGALAVAATLGPAAHAAPAPMGGSGDFYKHVSCAVNSSGTASLDVTNYDIATGQRYHMDMDAPSGFTPQGLYVDGVKQGGWNDRYKDFSNRAGVHTIKGAWFRGDPIWADSTSCSRTL